MNAAATVNGALTLTAGTLDIHGNALTTANVTGTTTVTDSAATATFTVNDTSADSFGGTLTGALALSKAGAGTLTLSGANSFTGGTTQSAGTLQLGSTSALGAAAAAVALSGGTLDLDTGTSVNAYNVTVSGTATVTSDRPSSGAGVTYTLGTLSIGAYTLNVTGSTNVTSGTAGVTFGATTFTGAPTFNIANPSGGGITLLKLGAVTNGSNTASFTGSGNFAQTGVWGSGTGGVTLELTYTGTVLMSQANTYTGATTVDGGTLEDGIANGLPTATALTVSGTGANFNLNGYNQTVGGLSDGGAATGTVTDSGATATLTDDTTGSNTFSGTIAGSVAFGMAGSGTVTLSGANPFTGGTTVSAGKLVVANSAALGGPGAVVTLSGGTLDLDTGTSVNAYNVTVSGNATITSDLPSSGAGATYTLGTLSIGADTLTVNAGTNVTSGTAGVTFGGTTTFSGSPTLNLADPTNGGSTLLTVGTVSNGGNTATFTGSADFAQTGVWGNGSGGVKLGSGAGAGYTGIVTLSQPNTFTGATTIDDGTLYISADNNLGTAPGSATANSLIINGGTLATTATFPLNANRGGSVGSSAGTIDVASGTTLTYNGIIANVSGQTGALTKTDSGTLVLGGNSTFTGTTTISGGTLQLDGTGTSPNSPLGTAASSAIVSSGGTLDLNGFTLAIAKPLTLNGAGFNAESA